MEGGAVASGKGHKEYLIALLHFDRRDFLGARKYVEQSLMLQRSPIDEEQLQSHDAETIQQPDHLLFANCVLLLANTLAALGDQHVSDAEQLYRECEEYICDTLGSGFVGAATCQLNHAIHILAHDSSRLEEATKLLLNSEDILRNVFGVDHLILSDVYYNLGRVRHAEGRHEDALSYFMRSLKIVERFRDRSGTVQLSMARVIEAIAKQHRMLSNYPEAIRLAAIALQKRRAALGPLSDSYADTLAFLGLLCFESAKYEHALSHWTRCYRTRCKLYGPEDERSSLINHYLVCMTRSSTHEEVDATK